MRVKKYGESMKLSAAALELLFFRLLEACGVRHHCIMQCESGMDTVHPDFFVFAFCLLHTDMGERDLMLGEATIGRSSRSQWIL